MPFGSIGFTELAIVLVIVLLIFGPKRLPGLGRQLGGGIREFKQSIGAGDDDRAAFGRPETDGSGVASARPAEGSATNSRTAAQPVTDAPPRETASSGDVASAPPESAGRGPADVGADQVREDEVVDGEALPEQH